MLTDGDKEGWAHCAENALADAFPWSERERQFGATDLPQLRTFADVDPGSDAQYLPQRGRSRETLI